MQGVSLSPLQVGMSFEWQLNQESIVIMIFRHDFLIKEVLKCIEMY